MKDIISTKELSLAAKGIIKSDVVIKNINLVNVCTREIIPNIDIAIKKQKICLVGDASHTIDNKTKIIDGTNKYACPGFLDGHMHIESSMLKPSEFAKGVIPHGTVGVFYDPHEICNILGLKGVSLMMEDIKQIPFKAMLTLPSCVPGMDGFESNNGIVTSKDVEEWMQRDDVYGLGEMMNMPGVFNGDNNVHDIIQSAHKHKKVVTGHFPLHDTSENLSSYIASGIRCCHETTRIEDAIAKMRLGMYVQIREGSAWQDLETLIPLIVENKIDTRLACLVTDDSHPNTIVDKGHINHLIKKTISLGVDPIVAIQMATINTATCFKMDDEYGSIAPYKFADIVIIDNLKDFNIEKVFINGDLIAENGEMLKQYPETTFPDYSLKTMNTPLKSLNDFEIKSEDCEINVIEIIPSSALTKKIKVKVKSRNGKLESDIENDLLKIAVFSRHNNETSKTIGFVKGFKLKSGALAQTVSHDAHNLIVIGTNDKDMVFAANKLINSGGGVISVENEQVISFVELSIAGLMSTKPVKVVSQEVKDLEKSWNKLGCNIESPFMTMSVLTLGCIQELRITDKGLIDSNKFEFINLINKK
ncbi:MAG: adenine deaminase [Mycoplasma sp.]